jgi:hypothetical protein
MSVVDDLNEPVKSFDFSTREVSFFNDPTGRLKTTYVGKSCDKSSMYVVTNASSKVLTDQNGSADVYQGDIPRVFVLDNKDKQRLRRLVDLDNASYLLKTEHTEYQRHITHSNLQSDWIVKDVCNTAFAILVADIKIENRRVVPFYYPSICFYDKSNSTFSSGGVSLKYYDKGTVYRLKFNRLNLVIEGRLDLARQTNLNYSRDGLVMNVDLDKVLTWKVNVK